jgi:hypothetical protein
VDPGNKTLEKFLTVRTNPKLSSDDFLDRGGSKARRKSNALGYIVDQVSQGGLGSAYLVLHEGEKSPAIYFPKDFEEAISYWKITYHMDGVTYFKELASHKKVKLWLKVNPGVEKGATVEGPFYSAKELEEGTQGNKSLFDHLTEEEND